MVRLPFKKGPPIDIGQSRAIAEKCLNGLSCRFQAHPKQAQEYSAFLDEYESLGHVKKVPVTLVSDEQSVFIPHHPVIREDRFARCNLTLATVQVNFNDVGNDPFLKNILWSDEAIFESDGCINKHNEHHYAEHNPHCVKANIQGRWTVNVWLGIIGDNIICPEFIQGNVNAHYYAKFLLHQLDELFEDVPLANRLEMMFQQDGHSVYTSLLARNILDEKFSGR
ncbi:transposable element tc1 transposase [Lasius niger]|uniref:Transposable element tc1 transposase n=1 Tax=Lasius niger TaxID=67767 RepID=A0A0J7NCW7_LASNI|nr:transposable element tc1 transposase [Lasius niger]